VAGRHLIVSREAAGTLVEETLIVENPADQTWLGGEPDAEARRTAVRVSLPEGASEIDLVAGFHGWCCTKHEGRDLAVQMPLMPGRSTFRYTYALPASEGGLDLRFGAPAPTQSVAVFVPDDGSEAAPEALTLAGTEVMGDTRMRIYQGKEISAGSQAGVVLAAMRARAAAPASPGGLGGSARTWAVVGGGALAALGIGAAVLRAKKPRGSAVG
jgi:hypothetical protein